jgi:hypothetical protein
MASAWEAFYRTDLQGLWSLVVLPALFLLGMPWLRPRTAGADPRAARFVRAWAAVFAAETIVDPVATVLLGASMLPFVLLGDFRVFLLVLGVMEPERPLATTLLRAGAWTLVVPAVALVLYRVAVAVAGPLDERVLWLVYECAFAGLALWWRARLVPSRRPLALRFLRAALAYVAIYYGLWALADALILAGRDTGWALRVVPNQLYYAFWVPFVWMSFFSPRYAAASSVVQARR